MYYTPCQYCKDNGRDTPNMCTDMHHLLSQTKLMKKRYGKLIHHMSNTVYICRECHLNGVVPKQTEKEFCKKLGIEYRGKR